MNNQDQLRSLPSVDEVLSRLEHLVGRFPRTLVVAEVRRVLELARVEIRNGSFKSVPIECAVERALASLERPSLRHVINATGVILHTNLGRAPLGSFSLLEGYSNLEFDLTTGKRGKRDSHISGLLERLLGKPAIAVNNNAAAVFLALHELASGGEVIVSRGELIEIGDGFRIPEIMARSGAILHEVGTTNRTHLDDYRAALNERTRLILRVHPSNFRIQGFTSRPDLKDLVALGRASGIPVYEDLGSGCIQDLSAQGIDEPVVAHSLRDGADLVSFSGDKLMGGPQAGIMAGDPEIIARLRRNPMYRALRLDKAILQVLEETIRRLLLGGEHEIPALRMIRLSADEIRRRAERFLERLPRISSEIIASESVIGGGSTPGQSLPTWLVALRVPDSAVFEQRLRNAEPAVLCRIEQDRVLVDLRTVFPEEEPALAKALDTALKS